MKKVLNANKTSNRVMRDETPEYEPSDISKNMLHFHITDKVGNMFHTQQQMFQKQLGYKELTQHCQAGVLCKCYL